MRCRALASRPRETVLFVFYVLQATRFTVALRRLLCTLRTTCTERSNSCSLTEIPSRRFAEPRAGFEKTTIGRSKANVVSRQRTTHADELIYKPRVGSRQCRAPLFPVSVTSGNVSLCFADVLVTQLGELGSKRLLVGKTTQIEDERIVLNASKYGNR